MILAATALLSAQGAFYEQMNAYIACVERGLAADFRQQDRPTRVRLYRAAAAHCQVERESAIAAAVSDRPPEQSPDEARRLAIDIIETLDPGSN